ncbi:MAG: hypothetical protein VCB25_10095, partial [Myxococcota bacterium]
MTDQRSGEAPMIGAGLSVDDESRAPRNCIGTGGRARLTPLRATAYDEVRVSMRRSLLRFFNSAKGVRSV